MQLNALTTPVDKEWVNCGVLHRLFFEGVQQPKKSPKKIGNAVSDALLMSRVENFAAGIAQKKQFFAQFFEAVLCAVELLN